MKKELKKAGSVQVEPVKGYSFDIRPSEEVVLKRARVKNRFGGFLMMILFLFSVSAVFLIYSYGKTTFNERYQVAAMGYEAFSTALESAKQGDFDSASLFLKESQQSFEQLAKETENLRKQALPSAKQALALESMDLLIEAALKASDLGQQMIEFAKPLESDIKSLLIQVQTPEFGAKMIELLKQKREVLNDFRGQMTFIQSSLTQVNTTFLPDSFALKLKQIHGQADLADQALRQAEDLVTGGLKLLGYRVPNRNILLFQNNREIRATGGFFGSFALTSINDGLLGEIKTEDVYHYANQFGLGGALMEPIPAPPGLDQINPYFSLQDANYSPDLLTSAKDIRMFLEYGRGPSFDTIITIDPTVAERILELSGNEIVLQQLTLNADDLVMRLMYYVESKALDPANPKGILFELIPEFKQRIESLDAQVLQDELVKLIKGRHIQVASFDPQVQSLLEFLGVDGGMPEPLPEQDFLAVVNTSSAGNKSDGFIHSRLDHQTEISEDGSIKNKLSINKNHTWGASEWDFWGRWMTSYGSGALSRQELTHILGEGANENYARVYVPLGSRLIYSEGIAMEEIQTYEDLGYTVFGFYFPLVSASDQKTVTLEYELPFKFNPGEPSYQFLARKQAGVINTTLKKSLTFDGREVGETSEGPFEEDLEWKVDQF